MKKVADDTVGDLAMIVSDRLYTDATQSGGGPVDPAVHMPQRITSKETRGRAWIWAPPKHQSLAQHRLGLDRTEQADGQVRLAATSHFTDDGLLLFLLISTWQLRFTRSVRTPPPAWSHRRSWRSERPHHPAVVAGWR
ncbi:hypothetical protein ACFY4C_39640 [Actinomadura viridis]|uniref:hypothetical protein n=1 Tax=Actinomadura viridis TaxID=58110 RepID=UPI0036CC09F3